MTTTTSHEPRRADHAIVDAEDLISLLRAARVGRVGVIADGEPYIVPMNFAYEDARAGMPARIIIHGASQGRLIEALAHDARVCVEVDELMVTLPDPVLCKYDTAYASVLCFGRARVLASLDERTAALRVFARKYAREEAADALKGRTVEAFRGRFGAHTAVFEIAIEDMTGKRQPVVAPAPRRQVDHDGAAPDLLAGLGNVPAAYRHHPRVVTPGDDITLPHAMLKWYEIRRGEAIIPRAFIRDARAFARLEAEAGALDLGHGLGFVILHYADALAYLIVCIWRNTNELWETLYTHDLTGDGHGEGGFRRVRPGVEAPALCVWELAPAWHEREAWVRYLSSTRDADAKRAYLDDRLTSTV